MRHSYSKGFDLFTDFAILLFQKLSHTGTLSSLQENVRAHEASFKISIDSEVSRHTSIHYQLYYGYFLDLYFEEIILFACILHAIICDKLFW